MRMDLAGEKFQVEAGYEVELPPGDHLIVVAGAHMGEPAYDFDGPNLAAKKSEIFEFKHYRRSGSKFWTSRAGISFYFVLPKSQIELVAEKGYSYVPVLIQGRKCHLNVSGGGGSGGWTDYVRRVAHIGCGWSLSALRQLAAIAVSPGECRREGVTLEIEPLADDQRRGFVDAPPRPPCGTDCKPEPSGPARSLGLHGQPGTICRRNPAAAKAVFHLLKRFLARTSSVRGHRLAQDGRNQRRHGPRAALPQPHRSRSGAGGRVTRHRHRTHCLSL